MKNLILNLITWRVKTVGANDYPLNFNNSARDLLKSILRKDRIDDVGLVGFGETFDKYILRVLVSNAYVYFIWTESSIASAFCEKVEYDIFVSVMNDCKQGLGF